MTKGQRGIHIMWRLSQEGLLCFGPHQGKEPTFTLLSEWVPSAKSKPRDESIVIITERYFTSHGPATKQDFMWWSGLTSKDANVGLEAIRSKLISEHYEGHEYWMPKDVAAPSANTAFLLPGFDEYVLGYKDRSAAIDSDHGQKIIPGNNGMFLATIVINGKIEGLWKKIPRSKSLKLTLHPFVRLDEEQLTALADVIGHYATFQGMPVTQ